MFVRTRAINKILALTKRIKVIQGGTWAGKTFAIAAIVMNLAAKSPNDDFTIVAETIPAIKEGAMKDFKNLMQDTGRWVGTRWNDTDRVYKFGNGSRVKFSSFDSVDKAKQAGKRDHLFINEANSITFEIADALMMRTSGNIWIDFNPNNEFWVHKELVGNDDVDFLILNYTDNDAIPDSIVHNLKQKEAKAFYDPNGNRDVSEKNRNIKSRYWANWCRVYIDGEIGSLEGVILSNWSQVDSIPEGARMIGYGLDFGFTNDPTAVPVCYEYNGERYWDLVIYQTGLVNSEIAKMLKNAGISKMDRGYADAAEPKSIKEINSNGLTIKPADKGKDSISFGIETLQEEHFYVTARSIELIKELRNYVWDTDKAGNKLNRPIDNWNHAIDAMRYLAIMTFPKTAKKKGARIYVS